MNKKLKLIVLGVVLAFLITLGLGYAAWAKRGCCSHHDGVCGCNTITGMQRCCDGTDSPTCRCGE